MAFRSGFFHAVKTGNTYDRVYNAEDHNLFLKGVVAQNGVYRYINGTFEPYAFQEHVNVEIDGTEYTNRIRVLIKPGKALVNGHWAISDADESVYLAPRPLGTGYRVDMITLRWNDGDRTISFAVTEGGQSNTKPKIADYPQPIGYISNPESYLKNEKHYNDNQIKALKVFNDAGEWTGGWYDSDVYFDPVTDDETSDLVQEICLGYVMVPAEVTGEDIKIQKMIGDTRCPYISFTTGPYDDTFVAQYNEEILQWWDDLRTQGGFEPTLNVLKKKFVGNDNQTQSSTIMFSEFPGYIYNMTDNINIYYNGLYVDEDEFDYVLDPQTNEKIGIKIKNGKNYIPADNSAVIEIYKAPSVDIPDGSVLRY